jgi:hypothetical protein
MSEADDLRDRLIQHAPAPMVDEFRRAVEAAARSTPAEALPQKSIEELAAEKGIGPIKSADDLRIHGITDEEADAFMAAMESTPAEALRDWAEEAWRFLAGDFSDSPDFEKAQRALIVKHLGNALDGHPTESSADARLHSPESDRCPDPRIEGVSPFCKNCGATA